MSPSGLGSSPFWSRHNNRRAAPVRDLGCRVTGYSHGCESTHVVPITESDWFFANEMKRCVIVSASSCVSFFPCLPTAFNRTSPAKRYVRNPTTLSSIDDERNMALLRHDIQWLFNTQCMTMAVKMATPEGIFNVPETPQLVSHVLQPDAMELIDLYQNRLMRGMTGVSVELMFTRFAWSVLNNEVMTFFRGRLDYTVLLFDTQKGKQVTRQMSGSKIRGLPPLFRSPSRARGNSASLHNHPSAPHLRHGLDRGRDPSRGRTRDRGQDQSRVSEEGRGAAVDQPVIYGLSAGVAQNYDRPEMSGAMPEWDTRSVQSYSTVVDENVRDEWMREEDEEERLQENVEVEEARGRGKKRNCSPPPCARSRSRSSSAISPSPAIPLLVPSPQNENEEEQPSVASSPMPSQHDEDEREDLSVAAPSPCTICGDKPCKGRPKRLRMEGRL